MTRFKAIQSIPMILATCAIAACSGGGDGMPSAAAPVQFAGETQTSGQVHGISTTSADSVRIGIPRGGRTLSVGATASPTEDQSVFGAYRNRSSKYLIFDAESANGRVSVFSNVNDNAADSFPGARAESFGGTLPTSGSATYTGEYVGFVARDASTSAPRLSESYIVGDVNISADFGRGATFGAINNRNRFATDNSRALGTMEDVTLSNLMFNNSGSGSGGNSSGGRIDLSNYQPEGGAPLDGNWSIAFGGENAASAGGTVQITHDYDNGFVADDYVETGGFAAAKN